MRLAAAAGWYWFLSGRRAEGAESSLAAAALSGEVPDEVRASAYLIVTHFLTSGYGRTEHDAQEWIRAAYRLAQRSQSRHPLLACVGPLYQGLQEPADFLSAFEPLLTAEDPWIRALARLNLGRSRLMLVDADTESDAVADVEAALTEFRGLGDRWGISLVLTFLAERLATRGEFLRACEDYEAAVATLTEVGAIEEVVSVRARRAQLYWLLGDEQSSASAMAEAQRCAERVAWPDTLAELALSRAQLARWRGDPAEVYQHLAAVGTLLGDAKTSDYFRAKTQDLYGYLTDDLGKARAYRIEAFHPALETRHPAAIAEATRAGERQDFRELAEVTLAS